MPPINLGGQQRTSPHRLAPTGDMADSEGVDVTEGSTPRFVPAFIDFERPVFREPGKPRCRWSSVTIGEPTCYEDAVLTRGTLVLCTHHRRLIARWAGFVDRRDVDAEVERRVEFNTAERIRQKDETIAHLRRWLAEERKSEPAKKARKQAPVDGTVYFLRVGGYIKIGWTSNLEKRMRQYQPDTQLLACKPGTRKEEHRLHRKFAHLKTHGREWFPLAPQITEEVEQTIADHGAPPVVDFSARKAKRIVGPRLAQPIGGDRRPYGVGPVKVVRG